MAPRRAIGVGRRRRWGQSRGRDGGAAAHALGMLGAGGRGQIRQDGGRRGGHGGGAPEEALARAVEGGARSGRVRQVGPERPARAILDDEDEAGAAAEAGGAAFVVQRPQADAVVLQAVDERPGFGQLEPWRHEQADLLGDRSG